MLELSNYKDREYPPKKARDKEWIYFIDKNSVHEYKAI